MTTESELIHLLAEAERTSSNGVDPLPYADLDRPAAYRIQTGVLAAVGASAGMLKTAIHADGVGVVAPIPAARVGQASGFRLSAVNVVGLEVEVGVVLARDLVPGADVPAAIDHYFLGVEICGSRFTDRKKAGPNGGLADSMAALGYAIGPVRLAGGDIGGLLVELTFAGTVVYSAAAKHAFSTVLASLIAYANGQHPSYPLRAGTIVTTGSMCGLVPTTGPGHVVARLGEESLSFDLV